MDLTCTNKQASGVEDEVVLKLKRDCKCNFFCCCGRSEMQVMWIEKGMQEYIGKVWDPWDICNHTYAVADEDNKEIYRVAASCCQLAFCCCCPCSSCVSIAFKITSPGHNFVMGKMVKKGKPICTDKLAEEYNNMVIEFPPSATWKQRALFMSCAIFIDYMQFEK